MCGLIHKKCFSREAAPFYRRPAIPVCLTFIGGIAIAEAFPSFMGVALVVLVGTAIWLGSALIQGRPMRWAPLLAVLAAGYLSLTPWVACHHGAEHVTRFLDDGYWRVRARVVDRPLCRLGRTRFVVAAETLSREGVARKVDGQLQVTVMGEVAPRPDDEVIFSAHLRAFRNFRNPGGFDYRRHMVFKGIHASAWVKAERLVIDSRPRSRSLPWLVDDARTWLGRILDRIGKETPEETAVLKALVYGDRSGIDNDLRQRFNLAGAGHLLAISGLHVGIVATLAFGLFQWIFSFSEALLWRGWSRRWAAGATLIPVVAYGILAGMSPSTQRAVIMVAVFLLAVMLGRTLDTLNTLAVAALTILMAFPPALFSISFQLSFVAVLAIVVGMRRFGIVYDRQASLARKAFLWLSRGLAVSTLAIVGTAPVVLHDFNQIAIVGIVANLVLVPLIGFLVVPLGLLFSLMAAPLLPVAQVGFQFCLWLIHLSLIAVDGFASLPFGAFHAVTPSLVEIVLYYVALWAVLNLSKKVMASWVLAGVVVAGVGDGLYWCHQRFWHDDFRVTAIDVGQGGATLLEFPGGKTMLIDGGGFSDNRVFDVGQRVVAPFLWRKKIASVDVLVLSHPDTDHLGGLIFIARHFNAKALWTNGDANTTWGYDELMRVCRERGIPVRTVDAGVGERAFGKVALSVLHPPSGEGPKVGADSPDSRNNASLVIKASFGETAFLFTGDITDQSEKDLVRRNADQLASTVLFVPHHGSRTSSSSALIAAVRPEIAVASAGAGNPFGFPHGEVVERYRLAGCRFLCTGTDGAITLFSDGENVRRKRNSVWGG